MITIVCYQRCLYCGRQTPHEVCHLHSSAIHPKQRLHSANHAAVDASPDPQAEWERRWDRAETRAWKRHFYREPEVCEDAACPQALVDFR